jgi:ATP-dependent DNA helicase DinG
VLRAAQVLGPGSPLASRLPGYELRDGQLAMAQAVEDALARARTLLVEAGTGTGKTLAYLIPAVLSGQKVVISTATRALQEQIAQKDLPLVREVLAAHGVTFEAAVVKGLGNYLCKRRLSEALLSPEGARDPLLARVAEWSRTTESGDRADGDLPEDAPAWGRVQSSSETRIGASCTYFDECFVTRVKRGAERANLVVVNHHLYCADVALRRSRAGEHGASVLPPHDAVIFDEAHQLEDVATDFFGLRVSSSRLEAMARDAERTFAAAAAAGRIRELPMAKEAALALDRARAAFFSALQRASDGPGGRRLLTRNDWTPAAARAHDKLDAALLALASTADGLAGSGGGEALSLVSSRAMQARQDLEQIVAGALEQGADRDEESAPLARVAWLETRERSASLGASPVDLGRDLRGVLFDRGVTTVLTSATLTSPASSRSSRKAKDEGDEAPVSAPGDAGKSPASPFAFIRGRLGAPEDADELVVPSPFDFAGRAGLHVPRDLPEPNDPGFEEAAAARIRELVELTGGGAFVLCTSARAVARFAAALRSAPVHLFVQGEAPKGALLERFRAHGDAVLVATMSFWEGVDVPGRALRLVVIDRIPFAVPTDPVVMARCEAIERDGGSPFVDFMLPSAALTLKQGFGRLVRSQRDGGIVALLDRRVLTKGYGRALLRGLPPARRLHAMADARAFWAEIAASLE